MNMSAFDESLSDKFDEIFGTSEKGIKQLSEVVEGNHIHVDYGQSSSAYKIDLPVIITYAAWEKCTGYTHIDADAELESLDVLQDTISPVAYLSRASGLKNTSYSMFVDTGSILHALAHVVNSKLDLSSCMSFQIHKGSVLVQKVDVAGEKCINSSEAYLIMASSDQ